MSPNRIKPKRRHFAGRPFEINIRDTNLDPKIKEALTLSDSSDVNAQRKQQDLKRKLERKMRMPTFKRRLSDIQTEKKSGNIDARHEGQLLVRKVLKSRGIFSINALLAKSVPELDQLQRDLTEELKSQAVLEKRGSDPAYKKSRMAIVKIIDRLKRDKRNKVLSQTLKAIETTTHHPGWIWVQHRLARYNVHSTKELTGLNVVQLRTLKAMLRAHAKREGKTDRPHQKALLDIEKGIDRIVLQKQTMERTA